jgi:hypothetical protein
LVHGQVNRRECRWQHQFAQSRPVSIQDAFDGIAEVIQDMEAVCHLHRLWSPACCSFGVGGTPVTRDDLDVGMGVQPLGQARRCPIREQFDRSTLLSIDQDRAVGMASPLAPVVDAQHTW